MANAFNWVCPTCSVHTTITTPNVERGSESIRCQATAENQAISLTYRLIECPNSRCKAQSFQVSARHGKASYPNGFLSVIGDENRPVGIGTFTFLPTTAQPLSEHVPGHVRSDYNEAYLIVSLSPKASATLARRSLQGMVRDFFTITGKRTLHQELEANKDQCDPELYEAMMAVKSVGNIGAHPEQDANLIVDVEPGEAQTLLQLIHLLDREWYVAKADRAARIAKMQQLGVSKAVSAAAGLALPPPQVPATQ